MQTLDLKNLSTEQKLGQLLVARSPTMLSPEDADFALSLIADHALGGVQVKPNEMAPEIIEKVLNAADYPIFIAADMERGFQLGDCQIAGNLALGALNDPQAAYDFARITATQAKNYGYNMIWSPDIDMAIKDSCLRTLRVMGGNKELTARLAVAYMKAFADCGVIGTAKHYPSITDRIRDTHMEEAVSYHTREELLEENLYPYREMIRQLGSDMMGVMSSHTRMVNIDPEHPVTFSRKCLNILREIGFDGLIVTDSLAMMGVVQKYGDAAIPGLAIAAGNDLLLPNYRLSLKDTYQYLLDSYRKGVFDEERLNAACSKVLQAQKRTLRQPAQKEITDHDRQIIRRINTECICAVTDEGLTPAIDPDKKHLFIVLKSNIYEDGEKPNYEIGFAKVWDPQYIGKLLLEKFPGSDVEYICEFPHRDQNERVCTAAAYHDDVIFVTFCEPNAYQGTDGLTERMRYLISTMTDRIAAVVHVGNPYAMEHIVHVPRIIFGLPHISCIETLPSILSGEKKACGKIPVNLHLKAKEENDAAF